MKTRTAFLFSLLLAANAHAVKYVPTIPGTDVPDPAAPGLVVNGDEAYYTIPNLDARDLTLGGYRREGNEWIPTLPSSGARDWSAPALSSDPDSIMNSPLWGQD
jgi:hypothetical protein